MEFPQYTEKEFARAKEKMIKEGLDWKFSCVNNKVGYDGFLRELTRYPENFFYYVDLDVMFLREKGLRLIEEMDVTSDEFHMFITVYLYITQRSGHLFDDFFHK